MVRAHKYFRLRDVLFGGLVLLSASRCMFVLARRHLLLLHVVHALHFVAPSTSLAVLAADAHGVLTDEVAAPTEHNGTDETEDAEKASPKRHLLLPT